MGIEDRDYFREIHAKKNGMIYNKKNATYRAADPRYFPKQFRGREKFVIPKKFVRNYKKPIPKKSTSFLAQLILTILICGAVFGLLTILASMAH